MYINEAVDDLDALETLMVHLDEAGEVPLAWAVDHAPDGSVSGAWQKCRNAHVIAVFGERTADWRPAALALLAALRRALEERRLAACVGKESLRVNEACTSLEAWLRGSTFDVTSAEAIAEHLERVAEALLQQARDEVGSDPMQFLGRKPARREARVHYNLFERAKATPAWSAGSLLAALRALTRGVAEHAARGPLRIELPPALAADGGGPLSRAVSHLSDVRTLDHSLVDLLKSHLPCPTIEQLYIAFRRG